MNTKGELSNVQLPAMPQVVAKIMEIDESNIKISSDQLQSLVSVDPVLTSKILKLANSAFYARSGGVKSLSNAITLLGFKTIKSLTLLVSSVSVFASSDSYTEVKKELWMRSVLRALLARSIAEKVGRKKEMEETFMAGLLKEIGQTVLFNHDPSKYEKAFKESNNGLDLTRLHNLEKDAFGYTSPQVSGSVMRSWKFPEMFVNVGQIFSLDRNLIKLEAGVSGQIVVMADALLLLNELTELSEISPELKKSYSDCFAQCAKDIGLGEEAQTYFFNDMKADIEKDTFYTFCSEMFEK